MNTSKYYILLIFIISAFSLYYPALSIGFLSDDFGFLYQLKEFGFSAFYHNFDDPFFIPLSHLFATITYYFIGANAAFFHAIQICVHASIAWQLYLLVIQLFPNTKNIQKLAFLSGFIFIIMPYNSEPTIWLAAKSYGYSVFFILLSIRYFFKWMQLKSMFYLLLHLIFCYCAILSKEIGYTTPLFIMILYFGFQDKNNPAPNSNTKMTIYSIAVLALISSTLIVRHQVLHNIIGGYGADVHAFDLPKMGLHFSVWMYKYLWFHRYASINLVAFATCLLICFIILMGIVKGITNIKYQKWKKKIILVLLLLFISLLPVLGLEITSYKSIESERYGYLTQVIMAVVFAFSIAQYKVFSQWFTWSFVFVAFIIFSRADITNWQVSDEVCKRYLVQLKQQDINNKKLYLINVPDNINGAYCLRNGIKEYLHMNGITVDINISKMQTFYTKNGGVLLTKSNFEDNENATTYYHKDLKIKPYCINCLKTVFLNYDKVLWYNNLNFYNLEF